MICPFHLNKLLTHTDMGLCGMEGLYYVTPLGGGLSGLPFSEDLEPRERG